MKLNKPIYVGCTVLELSKLAMYKFWYEIIKKQLTILNYYIWIQIALVLNLKKILEI